MLLNLKDVKFIGDIRISILDIICTILSCIAAYTYFLTKNWIVNNLLAVSFCFQAIESMFLGKFETGFIMLILLFFYDIFFVFGTDVMLTVAKSVDAPIKILFPKDWSADPPAMSLLGLGDIVLPGVFIALCLRYDVLKTLNLELISSIGNREGLKKEKEGTLEKILHAKAMNANKRYFYGCLVGYMFAIVMTVIVMLLFDHGQPALLYLVPGCLLSVCYNAWRNKEFKHMWLHDEMEFITNDQDEQEEEESKKEK